MIYFVVTFIFMILIIGIMAIGVMFGRNAIKGSCGGTGQCSCAEKCDKRKQQEASQQDSAVINIDLIKR